MCTQAVANEELLFVGFFKAYNADYFVSITEDDDWQFVSLNDQQNFGVKTAGLVPSVEHICGAT
jgi:hypothetical protein